MTPGAPTSYLAFSDDDAEALGALAKCAPPLRAAEDRADLRRMLLEGAVDLVGSDHSPCPPALKAGDAFSAWGGISGCQTLLRSLLTETDRDVLPLDRIAALTSSVPAARFGLARKGRLEPGADADLVLVRVDDQATLTADELLYRHPQSPFVGHTLRGTVVRTILRGRTIFLDRRIVGPPAGRLVRRAPA